MLPTLVHQTAQDFFGKAASLPVSPHSLYFYRVIPYGMQDFLLVIVSFRRLLTDHSSTTLITCVVPHTTLLRAYSVPLFMETSSSVGPNVSPSDTARNWPLVGLLPLATILWVKDTVNFPPTVPIFLVPVSPVWPCDLKKKSMSQIQDSQSSALLLHWNLLQTVRKS